MFDYEEVCPISKASSVLCERWTLQILREMFFGASRFSDFQRYLPKLSPSLLNTRLKTLEANGIIVRRKVPEMRGYEYQLTPTGRELKPVLTAMGKWGMKWAFERMDTGQLNRATIIRDFAVALRIDELPDGDHTIQFTITGDDEPVRRFILVRNGAAQVCEDNIGYDVDVYLTASLATLGRIWFGELALVTALDQGLLKVSGQSFYVRNLSRWLGTSQFADLNRHCL